MKYKANDFKNEIKRTHQLSKDKNEEISRKFDNKDENSDICKTTEIKKLNEKMKKELNKLDKKVINAIVAVMYVGALEKDKKLKDPEAYFSEKYEQVDSLDKDESLKKLIEKESLDECLAHGIKALKIDE